MTASQPTPYTQAMDDLHFSPAQLNAMTRGLTQAASALHTPASDTPRTPTPTRPRRPRAPKRLAAGLIVATLALCVGGIAAAVEANLISAPAFLALLFNTKASESQINDAGFTSYPLATCTSGGLTMALEVVIDDGSTYTCVFRIADGAGQIPKVLHPASGDTPNLFFGSAYAEVLDEQSAQLEGSLIAGGFTPFILDTQSDGALYLAIESELDTPFEHGQTVRVTLEDLYTIVAEGPAHPNPTYPGTWVFEFERNQPESLVAFEASATFTHGKTSYLVTDVSISPLGLEVEFQTTGVGGVETSPVSLIPMSVTLEDGSVVSQTDPTEPHGAGIRRSGAADSVGYGYSTINFSQLIDPTAVVSVHVGDIEIPVP